MSKFIQSMDAKNTINKSIGENGHIQHAWTATSSTQTLTSEQLRELFSQYYFQLVRTKDTSKLEETLSTMLNHFVPKKDPSVRTSNSATNKLSIIRNHQDQEVFENLYKLIGYTRDIVSGKGEYELTYMQILVWYSFFPELACFAILHMLYTNILLRDTNSHPYGSWKDVKYFCEYVKNRTGTANHMLIHYTTQLMVSQLKNDEKKMFDKQPVSLAGKWCPREKSKYSWLFKNIARQFYSEYFSTVNKSNPQQYSRAMRKASQHTRKTLAALNKHLDTTQVHMCNGTWSQIDFSKVTSITMMKQTKSFLNTNYKHGKSRELVKRYEKNSTDQDRIQCRELLLKHMEKVREIMRKKAANEMLSKEEEKTTIHGKRVSIFDFVNRAFELIHLKYTTIQEQQQENLQSHRELLDIQWKDNKSQNGSLSKFIPMVDTSGSMSVDNYTPLYNAIGLGIRMSEVTHPVFRNRIMTFSAVPSWVKLNDEDDFYQKVKTVSGASWGMNTDFYAAMKLILDVIVEENMNPEDVEGMVLAVFSDMQIDQAKKDQQTTMDTMYTTIKKMYHEAGMNSSWKKPYNPPHILFWNLRSTHGFPVLGDEKNVTTISGYNPVMMNSFCNHGMESLKDFTPYTFIRDILSQERFNVMVNDLKYYQ